MKSTRSVAVVTGASRGTGVTAFAISPGAVKTDMTAGVFAAEWNDPDLWSPPELTADLIAHIDSGALDALSGRYIHAARDDWRTMGSRADEISQSDLHTLRVRTD